MQFLTNIWQQGKKLQAAEYQLDDQSEAYTFFINNSFLILVTKIVEAFLKSCPKNLFSNSLVDSLLTSIV